MNDRLEGAGFKLESDDGAAVKKHYVVKQNDRYVRYDLPYEPIAKGEGVLRPEIKIEIAAFPFAQSHRDFPSVRSSLKPQEPLQRRKMLRASGL